LCVARCWYRGGPAVVFSAIALSSYPILSSEDAGALADTVGAPGRGHSVITPLDDLRVTSGPAVTSFYRVID
jgi:hypothetical protein